MSQLELSHKLGVSQRHISFVESGRSQPSRSLLLAWLQELDVPLIARNEALQEAGYASVYRTTALDDPTLAEATRALERLLLAHDPMPALALDPDWNIVRWNAGGRWLATALAPELLAAHPPSSLNLLDLLIHPEGIARTLVNLHEVGPQFLVRLRQEAISHPSLSPRVEAFEALLRTRLSDGFLSARAVAPASPVLTARYVTPHGELAFFSLFTTFGTPYDITLASLRIEHLYAADETTRATLARLVH